MPIEQYEIAHPRVPPELAGLRILHITDLHQRGPIRPRSPLARLLAQLPDLAVDLVLLTGDYQDHPGDEPHAARALAALASAWSPRLGAWGIWGNHDTEALATARPAAGRITWMAAACCRVEGVPLRIIGASYPEDCVAAALDAGESDDFTIALVHYPTEVYAAEAVGADIVLAGHTHGGQVRITKRLAPHTSCDLEADASAGVLRLRDTLCCTSRGLGTTLLPLRINSPAQAPIYTLRQGPLAGTPSDVATPIVRW